MNILLKFNSDAWRRFAAFCRSLASLGGPILVVQLLQVSMVAVDTVMAGRASSEDLSGVAIGASLWHPMYLFMIGLLSALTPIVAQHHGAQRLTAIPRPTFAALFLTLALLPIGLALFFLSDDILRVMGADDAIRPITHDYLEGMLVGLPAVLWFNVLRFYSDGVSLTRPAVVATALGALINVPLNYALIYGKWGFPALGGAGCGWASAAAYWVMAGFMLWVIRRPSYKAFSLFSARFSLSRDELVALVALGLPIGMAFLVESSMFMVIALLLSPLGAVEVAAHQIALNVSAVVFMAPMSLSIALTIRIGFLLGAGKGEEARFTALSGLAVALLYALVSATALWFGSHTLASFYNSELAVVGLAALLLQYAAVFQLGDAMQATAAGVLRGYKDTRAVMVIMLLCFWCLGLPLGIALGLRDAIVPAMGAEGFWLALVIALLCAALLLALRVLRMSQRGLATGASPGQQVSGENSGERTE